MANETRSNIRLGVPDLAGTLFQNDLSIILGQACSKAGLNECSHKFHLIMPGFDDFYSEGTCTEVKTKGILGSLVAKVYDYPNLKLGNLRLSNSGYPHPEFYSPRIKGWNAFDASNSSLAKIKDEPLRKFLAGFYDSLRDFPQYRMNDLLRGGFGEDHPDYKEMQKIDADFKLYFENPEQYYFRRREQLTKTEAKKEGGSE